MFLNDSNDWRSFLKYENDGKIDDRFALPVDSSDLNQASIQIGSLNGSQTVTRRVTSTEPGTWTPRAEVMAGVTTDILPKTLTFAAAGVTQEYTITFTRTTAAYDAYSTGYLSWTSGTGKVARIAMAVRPKIGLERTVREIAAIGAAGTVPIDVRSSTAQTVATALSALTEGIRMPDPTLTDPPKSAPAGSGVTGENRVYPLTVAADAAIARFAIDGAGTSDTDALSVTLWRGRGNTATLAATATPQGVTKNLDVRKLPLGDYELRVAVTKAAASVSWNLTRYISTTPASPTVLSSTTSSLALAADVTQTMNVTWTGLKTNASYLGAVEFGAPGAVTEPDWRTLVSITVPAERVTASVRSLELPPAKAPVTGDRQSDGTLVLSVSDTSAAGAGWTISIVSSPFVYTGWQAGSNIPAQNFVLKSVEQPARVSGQAIGVGGPNIDDSATGTLDLTRQVAKATTGFGSGSYLQNLAVSLTVPASSSIGLYTATITVTSAFAP